MRQNQRAGRETRDFREGRDEADTYNRRWYGTDGDEQDDEGRVGRYDTRRPNDARTPYDTRSQYDMRSGSDRERHESVYPYGGPRYSESSRRYEPAGDGNGGSGWGRERDVEGWRSGPDSYTRPQSARESWGTREGWADESYPGERYGDRSRGERYGSRGGYSGGYSGDDRWSSSKSTSGATYGVGGMQSGSWGTRGESGRPIWGNSSRYRSSEGMQTGEGTSFRGRGPKGYTRSDERIREEVNDRLTDDYSIDASDIECTVQSGEVTLTGSVPDREMKRLVEDLVESLSGVKDVQNNLRVKKDVSTSDRSESSSTTASRTSQSQTSNATTGYGSKSSR